MGRNMIQVHKMPSCTLLIYFILSPVSCSLYLSPFHVCWAVVTEGSYSYFVLWQYKKAENYTKFIKIHKWLWEETMMNAEKQKCCSYTVVSPLLASLLNTRIPHITLVYHINGCYSLQSNSFVWQVIEMRNYFGYGVFFFSPVLSVRLSRALLLQQSVFTFQVGIAPHLSLHVPQMKISAKMEEPALTT